MDKQIIRTIEAFQNFNEEDMFHIVYDILTNKNYWESEELKDITNLLEGNTKEASKKKFILRAPTGKRAEEYFIDHYNKYWEPVKGELVDTRDLGCGYDFKVLKEDKEYFIEVKGLSDITGGITFTNKEWHTAISSGNFYYLVVVKNLADKPKILFINNPAFILSATERIYTTVQIMWSVSENEIKTFQKT